MQAMENVDTLEVIASHKALGADIAGIDLSKPLSAHQLDTIRQAWQQHLVLRFRNQAHVSFEQQIAFSKHFGPLDKRPTVSHGMSKTHDELPPEIAVISNVKVGGVPVGALGDGEAVWHADMTYNEFPRCRSSPGDHSTANRQKSLDAGASPQCLHQRPRTAGKRGVVGCTVGSRHPGSFHLDPGLDCWRRHDVGQHLYLAQTGCF